MQAIPPVFVKFDKIQPKLILDVKAIEKIMKIEIRSIIQSNWPINQPNFTKNRPKKKYDLRA
jgi:hypothetical protein